MFNQSLKRELVKGFLEAVGITDPRTVAGLAKLADTKFVFGPQSISTDTQKVTVSISGYADEKPFTLTVQLVGELADNLQEAYSAFVGAPILVPASDARRYLADRDVVPISEQKGTEFLE